MIQVVVSCEHPDFTIACLQSLYANTKEKDLNILLIDNGTKNKKYMNVINQKNTVVVNFDGNYGVSTAINIGFDFCRYHDQDMMYFSNDHFVFPGWINQFKEIKFNIANSWIPYGLNIMDSMQFWIDNKDLSDGYRRSLLDYPEKLNNIWTYLTMLYGDDFEKWIYNNVTKSSLQEFVINKMWWAGCWCISIDMLKKIDYFRTDCGLANHEDRLWWEQVLSEGYQCTHMNRSYIHHFGSITTRKSGLTLNNRDKDLHDGSRTIGQLSKPIPAMSHDDRDRVSFAFNSMKKVVGR
jgi:GT2 family glycosyltransferase